MKTYKPDPEFERNTRSKSKMASTASSSTTTTTSTSGATGGSASTATTSTTSTTTTSTSTGINTSTDRPSLNTVSVNMVRELPQPLQFSKYEELPPNAVKLNDREVEEMQWKRIEEWPSKYEVWPFRYGMHVVSGTTAATAYTIDRIMRRVFILGSYQPLITLLPTLGVPCVCNMVAHQFLVSTPIITGKARCKTCYMIRGASITTALSAGYALLVSGLSCYGLARSYHTMGGRFSRSQRELFKIIKMPKQGKTILAGLFLGNYLIGGFLAHQQMDCLEKVLMKTKVDMDLEGFE